MNRLCKIFLWAVLLCTLPLCARAYSTGDDYPDKYKNIARRSVIDEWRFYNRECVSFTAWCLNSRNEVLFTNFYGGVQWSNAKNWGAAARSIGIPVDMTPAVGSVYWTLGPYAGGHVAWVAEVGDDGTVVIEEYNNNGDGAFHRKTVKASSADGYIHIKDIGADYATSPEMQVGGVSEQTDIDDAEGLFTDVPPDAWYAPAANLVYERGLMSGIMEGIFGATEYASRASVATILYRMEGEESGLDPSQPSAAQDFTEKSEAVEGLFTDVPPDAWYAPAVLWGSSAGIVSGNDKGAFLPDNAVTREELAVMLYRYFAYKGLIEADLDPSQPSAAQDFSDVDTVSPWAKEAVLWAVESGILNGNEKNELCPLAKATRGELAVILSRILSDE